MFCLLYNGELDKNTLTYVYLTWSSNTTGNGNYTVTLLHCFRSLSFSNNSSKMHYQSPNHHGYLKWVISSVAVALKDCYNDFSSSWPKTTQFFEEGYVSLTSGFPWASSSKS